MMLFAATEWEQPIWFAAIVVAVGAYWLAIGELTCLSDVPAVDFPRGFGAGGQEAAVVGSDFIVECSVEKGVHLHDRVFGLDEIVCEV